MPKGRLWNDEKTDVLVLQTGLESSKQIEITALRKKNIVSLH